MKRAEPKSIVLDGEPPVEVVLRRSARARRYSLRISRLDGRVTLTLPKRAAMGEGLAFVEEKADWIRGHLSKQGANLPVGLGEVIPFEGDDVLILAGRVRGPRLTPDGLVVPHDPDRAGKRVKAFLKNAARDRLAEASDRYSAQLGRPYARITLRDTRSRWGSCTSDGNLMYSWRLIMAPPPVLDYVAAHEVAHLAEMNHSSRFWAHVEQMCPDYQVHRRWLRTHGGDLHRYDFGD